MQTLRCLAVTLLLGILAAQANVMAAPGEATNLRWCPASKDCLDWDASVPPGAYRVDRGSTASLAGLANASVDSCSFATFSGTSTGAVLTQIPPAGEFFWYLVVATTCAGDGPAGNGSFGPRIVNTSGDCSPATCADGLRDGTESDVDCGGGSCPGCASGQRCCAGIDCSALFCLLETCAGASCTDGVKNGNETGVDCGGGTCPTCPNGQGCNVGSDCQSHVCIGGVCAAASCTDGVKNGSETGVDCGGGTCPTCPTGQGCLGNSDCQSGNCVGNVCQASSPNGTLCSASNQCQSGNCIDSVCCNTACNGFCQACNLAGSVGTCGNIPAGQDPANECAGSTNCNGAGACGP
jgi:hypothetical protein